MKRVFGEHPVLIRAMREPHGGNRIKKKVTPEVHQTLSYRAWKTKRKKSINTLKSKGSKSRRI